MQFDYPQLHWQDAEEQHIALHCYYHSRFVFIFLWLIQNKIKTKRLWLFHKSNVITTALF
ncbi:TPA_asm: hypothetical protein GND82_003373 [Salmonella enterica subsp. salamae serovar 60:g,m,t:z6]|uniref:Uncharacterized protein n=2 Tax=Salmonella enterica TaxID=28901 RepID=A0A702P5S5_SALER|nr:hypothetical protein [Salmonella enterica subsp. enterica]EAO6407065.1 hypothetical protein [Salmonella enterica]EBW4677639.1 hypothetical protein [Salmonella enterica subsp. salamae serovar Sofia]ECE5741439.1 hypothetical protein [Salmonella enterica subsp. salamae]EDW0468766.1 hypothetical protein [Salmonella enterica subsp. enterica serovar Victoria]HAC6699877.1 hypothetical protein [Salmonella bongori serovar 66:z65:-]HAE2268771.1 hypothetical protein [Salmonella enterica subsp. enteri